MSDITIWTYDWVPEGPRGFVRDLRLRWACEESGLRYRVKTVPFKDRQTNHLGQHPFGQVPMLCDGDIELFESGAGLLHIARKSEALMPGDERQAAKVVQWIVAALSSVEIVTIPWWYIEKAGPSENPLSGWMATRLDQLEAVLETREWLVSDRFTAADLLMADVLRDDKICDFGSRPATQAYVSRAVDRPAFQAAYDAQMEHFSSSSATD
ncbi:MAG: glutathione S-transferase family protein [Erythrobacter sp.]|uniref:glutathione S-transferase family protein n=1 Tax=Erythrobacter sp. TaxID=1042 RepID=UPI001B127B13|nr:glutathione S-transferase family protein [Erythrobacter sp.]MBO6767355.1 glutathione S-transferase family protein [Erythrobacter sp.]